MIAPKTPKPTPAEERAAYETVTERDQGRCVRCGAYGTVHRDHRQNRSQGGLTVVSNLQCLCVLDHKWATENPAAALEEGFACPSYAHPSFWPAYRFGAGWVILFDRPDANGDWWAEISEVTADLLMERGGR
tara:strand:- start:4450 stop:4845 length:396 start_codon:yes stop_codon:yes gene_type:complete